MCFLIAASVVDSCRKEWMAAMFFDHVISNLLKRFTIGLPFGFYLSLDVAVFVVFQTCFF